MKNFLRKNVVALSIAGLMVFGGLVFAGSFIPAAQAGNKSTLNDEKLFAESNCSLKTIKGTYSYTATGTILPGSPLPVPTGQFASIGRVTLDGYGNITEHLTNDNFNGLLLPTTNYTGTYTVDDKCGGTAVLTGRAPYKFTISENGKELFFMLDAPGTVVTGTARRQ